MNIYVHFPFCRSKCAYCALHSRTRHTEEERRAYVDDVAGSLGKLLDANRNSSVSTLYFGGGTPALCDLSPILDRLKPTLERSDGVEFTVELNPLDATPGTLRKLKAGGVNRISMGVQSLDDAVLREMGRPHTSADAISAWRRIRDAGFRNAGIDLICGWPGTRSGNAPSDAWMRTLDAIPDIAPDHCSVYTLILEPDTRLAASVDDGRITLPPDDIALTELEAAECALSGAGLERYEISSFAKPGMECRHNLATWRGEDYIGIGEGACSREGNAVSRVIFRLRLLKEGFSPDKAAMDFPELAPRVEEWRRTLDDFVSEGLLTSATSNNSPATTAYRLTKRGTEVCDTILAELV